MSQTPKTWLLGRDYKSFEIKSQKKKLEMKRWWWSQRHQVIVKGPERVGPSLTAESKEMDINLSKHFWQTKKAFSIFTTEY